jgi:transcriptional regulator with XRE-family HTH domain
MMESVGMAEPKGDWRSTLSKRLASERGSQGKFARDVDCSEAHLSLVLKGKRNVSYPLAQRIHDKTGIPVEELMSPPLSPEEGSQ